MKAAEKPALCGIDYISSGSILVPFEVVERDNSFRVSFPLASMPRLSQVYEVEYVGGLPRSQMNPGFFKAKLLEYEDALCRNECDKGKACATAVLMPLPLVREGAVG